MKNLEHLSTLIERLCEVMEGLREDLRPELSRTVTLKRLKKENVDREKNIGEAIRKFNA